MQIKAKDGANLTNDSDILRECTCTTKSTKITEDLEKKILALNTHTNLMKLIRKNARASYRREKVPKLSSQWNKVNHLIHRRSPC